MLGPPRVASRSIVNFLQHILGAGGVKRKKALSPSTTKILPIFTNDTAHLLRFTMRNHGRCVTRFALNTRAIANSSDNRIIGAVPIPTFDGRRLRTILTRFANGRVRLPPVCSTVGVGNGGLCRLTHRNMRIRHATHPVRICGLRFLRCATGDFAIHITYSGNACVHILNRSLTATLKAYNAVDFLLHARIKTCAVSGTYALRRVTRGPRTYTTRPLATITRLSGLGMGTHRTTHVAGNIHAAITRATSNECILLKPKSRFLNVIHYRRRHLRTRGVLRRCPVPRRWT